ncbi:hypothetical protein DASB73_033970 [Starmerella bacillaris]|uniref:Glutathione S-transferase n=1 Tax=Starmerella bacillaris TaxID=1247836 RepID=A0AAV5RLN3_STABA|nr:hypothetical protein DASB73_033970 [Starmerella bacillaris]
MSVTVHYLQNSRAIRVIWLLEELGVSYKIKYYRRLPNKLAPPELKKIHPSGSSPIIEDEGRVYAESGHILEYLTTKYGKETDLIWKNEDEENTIKYALFAAESNIVISGFMLGIHRLAVQKMPIIVSSMASKLFQKVDDFYATKEQHKCLKNLDEQIANNEGFYCNGRLTVADIMYENTITSLDSFFHTIENLGRDYPNIAKWHKAVNELPMRRIASEKVKDLEK